MAVPRAPLTGRSHKGLHNLALSGTPGWVELILAELWYNDRIICDLSAGHEKPGTSGLYADSRARIGFA
ncbi:hypothetical protein [Mucilaginibacter sp.]|uniref:hypothetical protein n=1 Tax=Mucilaginibacter sp. TaxID=1882438 RepID=UPI0028452857|nr:hypothetical protein [Mucilaginibacter sp.]MDR3693695.1 hypothetical protein [Mucilaginibacter sp.]